VKIFSRAASGAICKVFIALAFYGSVLWDEVCAARAGDTEMKQCQSAPLKLIPEHQPLLLNDPRSGLMLYVESDGRHMAAITRGGKIAWERNLFDDPRLGEMITPPLISIPGEPLPSGEQRKLQMHATMRRLSIDRIGIASDCETHLIDHDFGSQLLRGHYILAGSGTHFNYLLDAKTGDMMAGPIN
jgi:hypothetical protein